jgi:hypothetical protein
MAPTTSTSFINLANPERQQGRLHCLEQEQRDAGEQHAVGEPGDQLLVLLGVVGEQRGCQRTGVDQRCREHRAEQQPAEVRGDLAPRGRWPGLGAQGTLRFDPQDPGERRQGNGEAVQPDGLDAEDRQCGTHQDAYGTVSTHHDGVGVEPSVPAGDAA